MNEKDYIVFILAYDNLLDVFKDKIRGMPCDEAYKIFLKIASDFIDSDYYRNLSIGTYEALSIYLEYTNLDKLFNVNKETAVNLRIYFQESLTSEEVCDKLSSMLGEDTPYQVYDVEIRQIESVDFNCR